MPIKMFYPLALGKYAFSFMIYIYNMQMDSLRRNHKPAFSDAKIITILVKNTNKDNVDIFTLFSKHL